MKAAVYSGGIYQDHGGFFVAGRPGAGSLPADALAYSIHVTVSAEWAG